ncbi:MAG: hypothetical protein ACRD2C_07835, partial [Acidimicrobiales bacterium]
MARRLPDERREPPHEPLVVARGQRRLGRTESTSRPAVSTPPASWASSLAWMCGAWRTQRRRASRASPLVGLSGGTTGVARAERARDDDPADQRRDRHRRPQSGAIDTSQFEVIGSSDFAQVYTLQSVTGLFLVALPLVLGLATAI